MKSSETPKKLIRNQQANGSIPFIGSSKKQGFTGILCKPFCFGSMPVL